MGGIRKNANTSPFFIYDKNFYPPLACFALGAEDEREVEEKNFLPLIKILFMTLMTNKAPSK